MKPISKTGFTLIELIVVLFLIALATSIVFLNVKINKSLNSEEIFFKNFIELINKARVNSIVEEKNIQILINGNSRTVKILGEKKTLKIPTSITISAEKIISDGDNHIINFYSDGSSSGAILNVYGKNLKKNITIQKFNPQVIIKNAES